MRSEAGFWRGGGRENLVCVGSPYPHLETSLCMQLSIRTENRGRDGPHVHARDG